MNITSRQLKAFLLTARYQSFSRAADQLFITQSGMSVLVRELEAQLGFRLFERTTRKVTLTEFGSKFLPIADRSLIDLESAAADIGRSASSAREVLTVGAAPFVAADILPRAIAAYALRDQRLEVRLIDTQGPRLVEMVQSGQIDVAITALHHEAPGARRTPLARFSLMLALARGSAPGAAHELPWTDLLRRRLIGFPPHFPLRELVDEHLQRAGRHAQPDVVCNYLETQLAMVEVGAGVAVVPSFVLQACEKRAIVVHRLVDPEVWGNIYWLASAARNLPAGSEGFNSFLRDYIGKLSSESTVLSAQPV
jgi:DNA-binding transcriptional LysR family regulator